MRRLLSLLLLPLGLTSCDILQQVAENADLQALMPTVAFQDAVLVEAPSQAALRAYYCPRVVADPFGVPGGAKTLCQGFFGVAPALSSLKVSFDLGFLVDNPNRFPIPVAELLTGALVFPDKSKQSLGAACVQFCAPGTPGCTGQPGPGACQSSSKDIKSAADFQNAAAQFLLASGVSTALGGKPGFEMPQVTQESKVLVKARFTFGPQALLGVMEQLAYQSVDQLKAGKAVVFDVPYNLEGTVWLNVGSLGRVAAGFGPSNGTWVLPTSALLPDTK